MAQPLRWSLALLVLVLPLGDVARAHELEHLVQVALHPTDPQRIVLRYVQSGDGLIYSHDGGESWQLLCKAAVYPETTPIDDIVIAGDGHLLLGGARGAYEDDGSGCNFRAIEALEGRWVRAFARHPSDPQVTFAAASDTAGGRYALLRRAADGAWTELGTIGERIVNRLQAVQTDTGVRLYASALVSSEVGDAGVSRSFAVLVSDDEGASFREYPFPPALEAALRIEAVDPTEPDRVIATLQRNEIKGHLLEDDLDQVLLSEDQGETFTPIMTVTEISGVVFAPDGRMWIGDLGSTMHSKASLGIWFAASGADRPEQLVEYPVACLAYEPGSDSLLVCQRWWFGHADLQSGAFTAAMRFQDVQRMVECGDLDVTSTCELPLCRSYCTTEHFAQAPLCAVYDGPFCGPGAIATAGSGAPTTGGAGGVTAEDAGPGADADAGTLVDAGRPRGGDAGDDAARDGGADARGSEDDGCACSVPGARVRGAPAWPGLCACALFAVAALRRTARSRAGRSR